VPKPLALNAASTEDAARATLTASRDAGYQGLTAIPWNRFDPASSTWWLSPSTDNPAYKYGKIILTRRDAQPEDMLVGLYVEKGIGPGAAQLYADTARGRRYLMDHDWTWQAFVKALASSAFDQVMAQAESEAARPIIVAVDASNVPVPAGHGDDVHSASLPRDVARFEWSRGHLDWLDAEIHADILEGLGKPKTTAELAHRMLAINNLDWVWIDFHAGLRFRLGSGDPGAELWPDDRVWKRACRPWSSWLR
jgi:hypothetical protein